MRITLDTNVLVNAHSPGVGHARQLLLKVLRDGHRLILSQSMLYELEEVLHYPRIQQLYGLTDSQCRTYVNMLTDVAELVDWGPAMEMPLTDRDDWVVLRTAVEGNADYLCTSDGGFFKRRRAMSVQIELSDQQAAALQAKAAAQGLTLQDWLKKLAGQEPDQARPAKPFTTGYGMLAKYGQASSAEEIDENRREMFLGFAEDF